MSFKILAVKIFQIWKFRQPQIKNKIHVRVNNFLKFLASEFFKFENIAYVKLKKSTSS
jgi:hypothetical protein